MKRRMLDIVEVYDEPIQTPERKLWMAVIERAMKDYCFFFDKLAAMHKAPGYSPYYKTTTSSFNKRAIKELNRLRWFIFDKQAEEFNLTFLTEQFYEDSDGAAEHIRKVAKEQFKKNMDDAKTNKLFPEVREHISRFSSVDSWTAADEYVPLRLKRYTN